MQPDEVLYGLAQQLGGALQMQKLKLVTAESCTGGWLAAAITAVAGSSQWFERGFVTYSNEAKQEMLGVSSEVLKSYGAVSEQSARQMAEGALARSHAQVSVAITGIAGPGGGSMEKPVGLIWFGIAQKGGATQAIEQHFSGDRYQVRYAAVKFALELLLGSFFKSPPP